jgi:thiol-disulfide isomerase/thioredoxin
MDPVGMVVVASVLVAGAAGGAWWRRSDGRIRAGAGEHDTGTPDPADAGGGAPLDAAMLAGLGVAPGERATLLQFSSAYCAPCRAVSRISSEIAREVPGVRHVEVDAEEHLDAVKTLGIWRTPTLLVLDRDGRIVKRASGVPGKPQLIAAVTDSL